MLSTSQKQGRSATRATPAAINSSEEGQGLTCSLHNDCSRAAVLARPATTPSISAAANTTTSTRAQHSPVPATSSRSANLMPHFAPLLPRPKRPFLLTRWLHQVEVPGHRPGVPARVAAEAGLQHILRGQGEGVEGRICFKFKQAQVHGVLATHHNFHDYHQDTGQ